MKHAGDDDRRARFPERSRECKNDPCQDAFLGERNGHGPENGKTRGTQGLRSVFVYLAGFLKNDLEISHDKWIRKSDMREGD